MKVERLDAVLLNVSSLERARAFYGDQLGLPFLGSPEEGHVLVFGAGASSIVLHAHGEFSDTRPPGPEDPGAVLLFLAVDDVDAAVEELRGAGVPISAEPADQPWGERSATVLDPDGHAISLTRPLG